MINEIHKQYPSFGNATTEQELIYEVMHAMAHFGKDIKIVVHPKYYEDCFKFPSEVTYNTTGRAIAGVMIELSKDVDTYVFEFVEKE
ncbi:hypothetical protein PQE70_gp140 [Bacillus phage vB_BanS_Nate]|uniref:Uncharacterized protein n=1 Tax=Bacillus phage vB_BanS_Nate TaxID=2894788 RepID=A0AAE8YUF8_9CAUD|nr:hypothetical protein PQE70_gp140 [Bacillus phage vB_BanS_Nate]UGO50993.1 hypothetical protein NATE_140 [Bacillus phage vB_BanS_Nate]